MQSIRKKIFILSYIGNILLLIATFVPIIKFNNESFAFIDQFFYLSFAIVILVTISLVFIAIRKYKISIIPTLINMIIIVYGIYKILNIEGLDLISDLSYGIALILYPVGIVLSIIGNMFTIKVDKPKEEKKMDIIDSIKTDSIITNEPEEILTDNNQELNLEEQIPISKIMNNNLDVESVLPNNIDVQTNNESLIQENIKPTIEEDIQVKNENIDESEQIINPIIENDQATIIVDENNNKDIENYDKTEHNEISIGEEKAIHENIEQENNNIGFNENVVEELEDIPMNILDEDEDQFEEIEEKNSYNVENHILMNDIIGDNNYTPTEAANMNPEIPEMITEDENLMLNNTQIEDQPTPEFMALNPSDIKIEEKKPLFKKRDKQEEDPLEKIMKRNVPMTLERTCQFCNTPLGDDERICPICGRIN